MTSFQKLTNSTNITKSKTIFRPLPLHSSNLVPPPIPTCQGTVHFDPGAAPLRLAQGAGGEELFKPQLGQLNLDHTWNAAAK